jgi:MscS family membrane protein
VIGFLNAARKGNAEVAALYLNTPLRGEAAQNLARELALVLDSRLPARLNEISDSPDGSLPDPLRPDEDLVGTITTTKGSLDIMVERVDRGKVGKVWVFSAKSLASIPDVYKELNASPIDKYLPEFLLATRVATIPLFEWLAVVVGLPLIYLLIGGLNWALSLGTARLQRRFRRNYDVRKFHVIPRPIRLLLIALLIRWLLSKIPLPLFARQFWSTASLIIAISGSMWMLMHLTSRVERYLLERIQKLSGSAAVLRLVRRLIDVIVFLTGLLFTLHHFDINVTAALAGLGVGGIAVALAAQKTLENVIAGVSIIADQAVRVGDFLNLGDIVGEVQEVGLRSTRIRTLDRTLVSVPNSQIANIRLETLSARDKFWFHPTIGLRCETTTSQLRSVLEGVRNLLEEHPRVDSRSARVRFIRFATSSLDMEVFSYVHASDWNNFLEIQESLLLSIRDIVQQAGARIAFPSQIVYLNSNTLDMPARTTLESVERDAPAIKSW